MRCLIVSIPDFNPLSYFYMLWCTVKIIISAPLVRIITQHSMNRADKWILWLDYSRPVSQHSYLLKNSQWHPAKLHVFFIWFFTSYQQSFNYIGTGLPGFNQYYASINVLAQGHNAVTPVRLEPAAPQSRVNHSYTEPLRSLPSSMYRPESFVERLTPKSERQKLVFAFCTIKT